MGVKKLKITPEYDFCSFCTNHAPPPFGMDVTPKRLKLLVYQRQPEAQVFRSPQQGKQQEEQKENVGKRSPALDEASADIERSARPASPTPPAEPSAPSAKLRKEVRKEVEKPAWRTVARRKPPATRKVDKNVLSARGGGGSKRKQTVDAGSAQPTTKPSSPEVPPSPSSDVEFHDAKDDGQLDEMDDAAGVALRVLLNELDLYRTERGGIVGIHRKTGENYGSGGGRT